MSETYNHYVTEEAQKQAGKGVDGVQVYKVRRPKKGEEVVGYNNIAESFAKQTETEKAAHKGD